MKNQKQISELREACNILGLNPNDFVEASEIEKGVDTVDYKVLYEQQKELNTQIILSLGKLPGIISENLTSQFSEIQKSVNGISDKINIFEQSPLHQAKSCTKVNVIEKAVQDKTQEAKNTYSISNPVSLKALKTFLGGKTMEFLQKGVSNSIYERAAMQLDANKCLTVEIANKLFEMDKIKIVN